MSKISKIKTLLQNVLAQFAKLSTDKGLLSFDGDVLEVGMSVMVVDEEGNETTPEDGEYTTDENVVYVVADGKVTEIREPETEEPAAEPEGEVEAAVVTRFSRIKAALEESYEEKELKIIEAVRAKGFDSWLVEAGDDYAIVEVWIDETGDYTHYRFPVSWTEEGDAVVGDPEEVKSEYVPVNEEPAAEPAAEESFEDETDPAEDEAKTIENLEAEVARLEQENGELRERIAELEAKLDEPGADPATEEFAKVISTKNTDDEKLSNLRKYFKN